MESEGKSGIDYFLSEILNFVEFFALEKPMKALGGGQVCQICSDSVGTAVDGEPFVPAR
ncbi:hypothetical protein CRG98_042230 [Punica granatum]|uniref:Cellulose synthase RING-type zinc finger domain-containing protein n=1 Tax=Punica granatum TaxID=22663 RepID=A0A2I0I0I8_PUNGR|nr:hypothetical protein CRG98_042230 [Punica granatum]